MIRITIEGDEWVVLLPPEKHFECAAGKEPVQSVTEHGRILRGKLSGPWRLATSSYTERFEDWVDDVLVKTRRKVHVGNYYIRNSLNAALVEVERQAGNVVKDQEDFVLVITSEMGNDVRKSNEYQRYVKECPEVLGAIIDQNNPNRKHVLVPFLYGFKLVVLDYQLIGPDLATVPESDLIWNEPESTVVAQED